MILDNIKNCEKYEGLNRNFDKAFEFLRRADLVSLAVGKYEIDGENIFAMVQEYETKDLENAKYEAHKKYIDIQYLMEGTENMGYVSLDKLEVFSPYNEESDFMLLEGEPRLILLNQKEFFILFPEDAHMPGIFVNEKSKVKKVVVKVSVC
jgi:YhcH/YjgK/YiaL family protein